MGDNSKKDKNGKIKIEGKVDIKENWKKYKSDLKESFKNYLWDIQLGYKPLKPEKKEDLKTSVKKLIRCRKGRSVEAEIENVFIQTNCCNNRGEYPYHIATTKKSDIHYQVMFKLPYGLNFKYIIDRKSYFADSIIAHVNIEKRRGLLMVEVIKGVVPELYRYNFNYAEYMDKSIPIPIGVSVAGMPIIVDLAIVPHIIIGGVTRSGKSILLTGICDAIMQNNNVKLFVTDLAMTDFVHLKDHIVFGYNLDTAEIILECLMQEVERRRYFLVQNNCVNLIEYNEKNPNNKMNYIVLVIDEFAFTSPRKSDDKVTKSRRQRLQNICADLGMISAKTGIHLIIAMQRPSDKLIPMEIKSNFPCAISFKTVNYGTSMTVLGNTDAYYLPNIKGRMIFQYGSNQMELQAMLLEQKEAIRRLAMFDNKLNRCDNVNKASYFYNKGDDLNVDPFIQFQINDNETKRLLPR